MKKNFIRLFVLAALGSSVACSSGFKARQEMREKTASSSGLFCEFVSGDEYTDVDVEINLRMAKRCDPTHTFSLTSFKNASDNHGIVYCCNTKGSASSSSSSSSASSSQSSASKSVALPAAPAPKAPAAPAKPASDEGALD